MRFVAYRVRDRLFNLIFETQNLQGDGLVLATVVIAGRGYQVNHMFWDIEIPEVSLRLFQHRRPVF